VRYAGKGVAVDPFATHRVAKNLPGQLEPPGHRRRRQLLPDQPLPEAFRLSAPDGSQRPIRAEVLPQATACVPPHNARCRLGMGIGRQEGGQHAAYRRRLPGHDQPQLRQLLGHPAIEVGHPPGNFILHRAARDSRHNQRLHLRLDPFGRPLGRLAQPECLAFAV
jgi:hypothetical protein